MLESPIEAEREARRRSHRVDPLAPPMRPGEAASPTEATLETHVDPAPAAAVTSRSGIRARMVAGPRWCPDSDRLTCDTVAVTPPGAGRRGLRARRR